MSDYETDLVFSDTKTNGCIDHGILLTKAVEGGDFKTKYAYPF
jgi:hypothetical protein